MHNSFAKYLGDLPLMRVMRVFMTSQNELSLRSIVAATGLSVGGTADILRRISDAGVIKVRTVANRKCYDLNLSDRERSLLRLVISLHNETWLQERAERFSLNAAEKLEWMDDTYSFFKQVKSKRL